MEFILKVKVPNYSFKIHHDQSLWLLGSCFTEHIGSFLEQSLFKTVVNPCGIIYNPISLLSALQLSLGRREVKEDDVFQRDGVWFSWLHHGQFWGTSKDELMQKIQVLPKEKNPDILLLTLGTSFVYQLKSNGKVVANCHKVPGQQFSKSLLKVETIVDAWVNEINALIEDNPALKIILTVSPVRHWRDGAAENTLSKSILIQSVHELTKIFPEQVFYFPAYEIVLDELRDYRFFKEDMIHPSEQAVAYVWQKFKNAFFAQKTIDTLDEILKVSKAAQHRPINEGNEYQIFRDKTVSEIQTLKSKYPSLDFSRIESKLGI